jgi:hypothetical protein
MNVRRAFRLIHIVDYIDVAFSDLRELAEEIEGPLSEPKTKQQIELSDLLHGTADRLEHLLGELSALLPEPAGATQCSDALRAVSKQVGARGDLKVAVPA